MRVTLRNMVTGGGYQVVGEAENGRDAVAMYKDLLPDIVMMDITMPEMDGIEAVRNIVKEDSDANIVMCSAMGQKKMIIEAIDAGAKDFIVKPFNEERVLEALGKISK